MATVTADAKAATGAERYSGIRRATERLCVPLETEDFVVQSMGDVSPTKWHLAHTSWFFETFVLSPHLEGYRELDPAYRFLFNSYYVQAGERHCRAQRGYISRPTVAEVFEYRRHVDAAMEALLESASGELLERVAPLVETGLHHEQQHQELMLTDIKHVFSVNPLRPVYGGPEEAPDEAVAARPPALDWVARAAGLYEIGHAGPGFAYDNERPRHRVYLERYALASRPVTSAEYLAFMEAGGYERPELWLSLGWAAVEENEWSEPFYWEKRDGEWWTYTLGGMRRVHPHEPAVHLSYFEADAYARWADARLPSEAEWEVAATDLRIAGNFVESGRFHPAPAGAGAGPSGERDGGPAQMYGDVWEWTRSQYDPYPGYRPPDGALGEYNGKFMCNQFVLRGGSCATPGSHIRPSYRNFFPPDATWQFTGVRLARDL
ncbi:MAG TPA: ergothioneine biosynthesis protein EgtB [Longimicrobiales bacterium]|nr:ergothioneine biosynthesis protein EgtB [Longimicrobiales bacterium]